VPITQGSRVLGAMSLRYLGAALSEAEAVRRYLRPLQRTARAIAEAAAVAGD
jgi:hypothetical protein